VAGPGGAENRQMKKASQTEGEEGGGQEIRSRRDRMIRGGHDTSGARDNGDGNGLLVRAPSPSGGVATAHGNGKIFWCQGCGAGYFIETSCPQMTNTVKVNGNFTFGHQ
jgi:hypothetical protein